MRIRRERAAALFTFLLLSIAGATASVEPGPGASSPPTIPDTPAGRRLADLVALSGAGDESRISAYVRENFTAAMQRAAPGDPGIVPFLASHAKSFGGFEIVRAISSVPEQVTMLVRTRSGPGRWFRYIVKVESEPPHRVEGLFLMPATPAEIPREGGELSPEQAIAELGRDLDRRIAEGSFSGVALLAREGEVALLRTAGEADREHHVPVKTDTVFGIASMNKMFTAVAIGRLVEQGKLSWSDPVERHLKGWLPEGAREATIDHLLTHTSGLGDYLDRVATDPAIRNARALSVYRDLVRASSVEGEPGREFRYSNAGYVVLGALIEAVTGRDYFEFVREEVFRRAGMTRTDSWCLDDVVENRAVGYLREGESEAAGLGTGAKTNLSLRGVRGTSAGGGYSTAGDLLRFARALVEGKIVGKETLAALLAPRVRFPVGGDYGYGFVVHRGADGSRIFGHAGGFPGAHGELKIYADGRFTLVALSNVSAGAGDVVAEWDRIASRLAP